MISLQTKIILWSIFMLIISATTVLAQVSTSFDAMQPGDVVGQHPDINLWPALEVTSPQVTNNQFNSAPYALELREANDSINDDILFGLLNQNAGVHSVRFNLYVPLGKEVYWNIQNQQFFNSISNAQWNGEFQSLQGQLYSDLIINRPNTDTSNPKVAMPYDTWFPITIVVNLDSSQITVDVNGQMLLNNDDYLASTRSTGSGPRGFANQLGAINFTAIDTGSYNFFVDDFVYVPFDLLSVQELPNSLINFYPNPVQDYFQLNSEKTINSLRIFNSAGQLVKRVQIKSKAPTVYVGDLKHGVYYLNVTMGQENAQLKFVK